MEDTVAKEMANKQSGERKQLPFEPFSPLDSKKPTMKSWNLISLNPSLHEPEAEGTAIHVFTMLYAPWHTAATKL